jgi:GT2 family glycosyltransferase
MSLRVSVIIVNYNVKEFLLSCIKSIYNNMKRDEVEIIVVDNASTDNSEQAVKNQFPDVVWISNNYNAGFSEANNQGMNIAKSPVLFLLNPDTELTDGALEGLIEKQKEFPNSILVPQLLNSDGSLQVSCWRFPKIRDIIFESLGLHLIFDLKNYNVEKFSNEFNPDCASGAALLFGKNVFISTGGLDKNLFWSEDIDFCYRASLRGIQTKYFPLYKIYHHSGKSSSQNLNIPISNQLLSKAKYFAKNSGRITWIISLCFILLHIVTRIIAFSILSVFKPETFTRKRKAYIYTLHYYFDYLIRKSKAIT